MSSKAPWKESNVVFRCTGSQPAFIELKHHCLNTNTKLSNIPLCGYIFTEILSQQYTGQFYQQGKACGVQLLTSEDVNILPESLILLQVLQEVLELSEDTNVEIR